MRHLVFGRRLNGGRSVPLGRALPAQGAPVLDRERLRRCVVAARGRVDEEHQISWVGVDLGGQVLERIDAGVLRAQGSYGLDPRQEAGIVAETARREGHPKPTSYHNPASPNPQSNPLSWRAKRPGSLRLDAQGGISARSDLG